MSTSVKQLLRRPIILVAAAVIGFMILFPKFGPREVVFRESLPRCADELIVSAHREGKLMRSHKRALRGETTNVHSFELPTGEYLLRVEVSCGANTAAIERTLVLDQSGDLEFDLSDKCQC